LSPKLIEVKENLSHFAADQIYCSSLT